MGASVWTVRCEPTSPFPLLLSLIPVQNSVIKFASACSVPTMFQATQQALVMWNRTVRDGLCSGGLVRAEDE